MSGPQRRYRRSDQTLAEGDRPLAIVEHESQFEIIAAGAGQLPEALEVVHIDGSIRLNFDTHQRTNSILDDEVNFVLIPAAVDILVTDAIANPGLP